MAKQFWVVHSLQVVCHRSFGVGVGLLVEVMLRHEANDLVTPSLPIVEAELDALCRKHGMLAMVLTISQLCHCGDGS